MWHHLHAGAFGGARDAQRFGDAAAAQVGLHDAHGAGAEKRRHLNMRAVTLADGQRSPDTGGECGMRRRVLGRKWALQPERTAAVQLRAERRSGLRIEPPLRVHRYVLRTADGGQLVVALEELALAGVMEDLESAAARCPAGARVFVPLGAGVARQIVDVASQPRLGGAAGNQSGDGGAMDLAGQVPQSDIDGGDGVEHEAAGLAAHAHLVVHGVPESFNLQAGAAELFSFERRFQNGMNDSAGDFGGGESLRFAPARQAGIRGDARQQGFQAVGAAPVSRDPNDERFQRDDFHAGPLPPVLALGADEWETPPPGAAWQTARRLATGATGGLPTRRRMPSCPTIPDTLVNSGMRIAVLLFLTLAGAAGHFVPEHRVSGIGVARDDISSELLEARTRRMIQSQTFVIMREPQAVAGARRILSPSLQALFRSASERSGMPAELIEAMAYLESWGDAKAESPDGPKGIMQISEATARTMGLKVVHGTRYKITREKVPVKSKSKKPRYRIATHKTPYQVTLRDDRLVPARAIPAAAHYLAGMERNFGGRDWAIFAYHCGQGCVTEMQELTRRARGIPQGQVTVPRMFFSCSPAWNRDLYQAIQQQMQRDYSPTYYFRVMRAEQLLALYRRDPAAFVALIGAVQEPVRAQCRPNRAPHRLSVWLKQDDLVFHSRDDIRGNLGNRLVKASDRPAYLGYSLGLAPDAPAIREILKAPGGHRYPGLYRLRNPASPRGDQSRTGTSCRCRWPRWRNRRMTTRARAAPDALAHSSGHVFDIELSSLPPGRTRVPADCAGRSGLGWFPGLRGRGPQPDAHRLLARSRAFFTEL